MSMFLRWWLLFCTSCAALFTAYSFGFIDALIAKDITRLSFVILGVFFAGSIFVGWLTYKRSRGKSVEAGTNIGWFITELLLALGMIGTVIGFILMLGGSFESLNIADTGSVKTALTDMAIGMSTALYTTLVGMVCSQILKVQLVNVESR
tara:strand:- start:4604 stop:5053 length:450 start_codon:yes stop_codon:yes gene_type:complete